MLEEGCKVVIVSASINNWVEPFFAGLDGVTVIGTMIEERNGLLRGVLSQKTAMAKRK